MPTSFPHCAVACLAAVSGAATAPSLVWASSTAPLETARIIVAGPAETVEQQAGAAIGAAALRSEKNDASPYLGLLLALPDEALAAQLGLQADRCLVVRQVEPDSPAAKAGVKRFDIVLAVDDSDGCTIESLRRAVLHAAGEPLALRLLRRGKPLTIRVVPAHRAKQRDPHSVRTLRSVDDADGLQQLLQGESNEEDVKITIKGDSVDDAMRKLRAQLEQHGASDEEIQRTLDSMRQQLSKALREAGADLPNVALLKPHSKGDRDDKADDAALFIPREDLKKLKSVVIDLDDDFEGVLQRNDDLLKDLDAIKKLRVLLSGDTLKDLAKGEGGVFAFKLDRDGAARSIDLDDADQAAKLRQLIDQLQRLLDRLDTLLDHLEREED